MSDIVDRWGIMLATAEHAAVDELYLPDALFDINLPQWRFQLRGPGAIRQQLDEWHPIAPDLVEWNLRPTSWGAVVELALWEGDDHGLYSRSVHLFDLHGERIARHVMYCIGDMSRATFERSTGALLAAS